LGKKARNAASVNADYKVHDENAQLSVIRKQKAGDSLKRWTVKALCLRRDKSARRRGRRTQAGRAAV